MSTRLTVQVQGEDGGWRPWWRVTSLVISSFEHGYEQATGVLRMPLGAALGEVRRPMRGVRVMAGGAVWEGRLDGIALVSGGVRFVALGLWQAWRDDLHTGLWRDGMLGRWREPWEDEGLESSPERFVRDKLNRLQIELKESSFGIDRSAGWAYTVPHRSVTLAGRVAFDYELVASNMWRARVRSFTTAVSGNAWAGPTIEWELQGSGRWNTAVVTQTGSVNLAITAGQGVVIDLWRDPSVSGSDVLEGMVDGDSYLRLTGVVVSEVDTTNVDEVVRGLIGEQAGTWIDSSEALVETAAVAVTQGVYEDENPADILRQMAAVGDGVEAYEVGVREGQRLYFRPRGTAGRRWVVWLDDLEIENSVGDLANEVYGVYETAVGGVSLRTARAADEGSVARWGVRRVASVDANTISAATAEGQRDLRLVDGANPKPRLSFVVTALRDGQGARVPAWALTNGDEIVLGNLPLAVARDVGEAVLRVNRTELDVMTGRLKIETDSEIPRLETYLLRRDI